MNRQMIIQTNSRKPSQPLVYKTLCISFTAHVYITCLFSYAGCRSNCRQRYLNEIWKKWYFYWRKTVTVFWNWGVIIGLGTDLKMVNKQNLNHRSLTWSSWVEQSPQKIYTGQIQPWSIMMTSSNGNNFRVTGHLCGEFTGPRWIPHTNASDAGLWCFLWSASE